MTTLTPQEELKYYKKLLKRTLDYICSPANERFLKERASIIEEGKKYFDIKDRDA